MRVTVSLPEDVYWQAKREAADEHRDLEEYIEGLVVDAVDVETPDSDGESEAFEQAVYRWFDLDEGTTTAGHVAGVARRLRDGYDFAEAVRRRADEYRRNHDVGDTYENTVRAACTRRLGFEGEGATQQFVDEVEELVEAHEE
jgi:hypothetical protein